MTAPSPIAIRRALRVSEKDVERMGDQLAATLGWQIVRFSQPRKTMQTEGIPDRRYYHALWRRAFWWEAKAPGGTQRPAQRAFQAMCEACGETYVLGGIDELAQALRAHARP